MANPESQIDSLPIEPVLARFRQPIARELRRIVAEAGALTSSPLTAAGGRPLDTFYAQIEYHLGWRHADLSPAKAHPGKLLRPTLLLLACELGAAAQGRDAKERDATIEQALPAAAAVELVHNFSLVHDDIEDGDEARRHRPTLWTLWGVPQAINTGDGIFSLARAGLWQLPARGTPADIVVRLADRLDRTCLELCEGQFLDMSFEGRDDITTAMYLDMIGRKTAALMACATEMGAIIGAPDDRAFAAGMAAFGRALGLAFQLRDDLLGIWAPTAELGKTGAGDLRRKKMTLPVIYARETASGSDRAVLAAAYASDKEMSAERIAAVLDILERTGARDRVRAELRRAGEAALAALGAAAGKTRDAQGPYGGLAALAHFVSAAAG
ncbi:MAG TPA: polyprenyl synthetase family protein [Ktedonobacterales bacterium]|nr:polyprenyl synthetase family protein [Ktedonobacterales bacterium]